MREFHAFRKVCLTCRLSDGGDGGDSMVEEGGLIALK